MMKQHRTDDKEPVQHVHEGKGPLELQPRVCFLGSLAVVAIVVLQLLPWLDVPGSHQTEAGALWKGNHLCDHIGLFAAVVH